MNAKKLTWVTLLGLTLVCLAIGLVGGRILFQKVEESKIRMQAASNSEYAQRFASMLGMQLASGVPNEQILSMLQASFRGTPPDQDRFLCVLSDEGKVLCHPRREILGNVVSGMQFRPVRNQGEYSYREWVEAGMEEGMLLDSEGEPVQLVQRVPVEGTPWNVMVHTNIGAIREEVAALNRLILAVLIPMGISVILIGTMVVRTLGRRYETAIEEANSGLEDRVAERTSELEQTVTELQQARNALMLNEKLALLGQLMAGIAHEIRNPLGAISLFAASLEERADDEETKEAASKILQSTERCELLVRNLLSFARNDEPHRESIPMSELIEAPLRLLSSELKGRQVNLEKEVGESLPEVRVDRIQMEQVVLNLVTNALQELKSQEQPGKLRVKTETAPGLVRLIVEDSGRGLPGDIEEHLFEPFRTSKPQGTGLGLSLCRRFVERHGGTICYDRSPELGGARFVVELPLEAAREIA